MQVRDIVNTSLIWQCGYGNVGLLAMQVRDIVNASLIWQCGWRRVRRPRKTLLAAWAPPAPVVGGACG